MASGWAGSRCLPTPQRSGAAGCCRAGSGAAGCCRTLCGAGTGAARGCCSGSGVSGPGPGSGTGWFPSPPGAVQPPPPFPWVGRTGSGARQCDTGGQGSAWGRPSGAPLAAQGSGSPSAAPGGGGGLLSLGFTRQVQSSGGGGGAPNPPQPHLQLRARMGERTARDVGRVAPRRIPHRTEAQVLPSRCDTLGGAGVRAFIYLYTAVSR